jgi:hypothetical protein
MLDLRFGYSRTLLPLSNTRRYLPDELMSMMQSRARPHWLYVDGVRIELSAHDGLWVGCQAVAAYHNYLAYNAPAPDGFQEDMEEREAAARAHMEASSSSEASDGYVTSEEDMEYPTEFYL